MKPHYLHVTILHLLLFVFSPFFIFSRNVSDRWSVAGQVYYVDALLGNDNNSGLSASAAWQSLAKVNAVQNKLQPGDQVLFHRGQVFNGGLRLRISGVSYGAYSSGSKPVINGFTTITGWSAVGAGVYEASCNSGAALHMVVLNEVVQAMGRYPNADAPRGGYLTIDAHAGTTSITSSGLAGAPVFTGGEAVIRKRHWVLDRCAITSQSGTTLTYISPTGFDAIDGFGFFIQNHPATLDRLGEWWYDAAHKKLRMFFGAAAPSSYTIRAATTDTLINVSYDISSQPTRDISLSDLQLTGADTLGINVHYSSHLSISRCDIDYTGANAINADNGGELTIEDCSIDHTSNKGIHSMYSDNVSVNNTRVTNTGLLPGMGESNNQNHTGIGLTCTSGCRVTNSRVDSSGYCGIAVTGNNFLVQHNYVSNFCMTVDDGGGIYSWGADGNSGRQILGNIVINGWGTSAGTEFTENSNAHGIDLDDRSVGVTIASNSVWNCSGSAITIHNSHGITIVNNTTYDAQSQLSLNHDNLEPDVPIRNVVVKGNILVAKTEKQYVLVNSSLSEDFADFGLLDSNYYSRPVDSLGIVLNYYPGAVIGHNLEVWRSLYYHDQHTTNNSSIVPYKVSSMGSNIVVNGSYDQGTGGTSCASSPGSCTLSLGSGHLDGGELQVNPSGSTGVLYTNLDLGPVTAGRDYILHFTTLGTGKKLSLGATILHAGGAFENRSGGAYFPLTAARRENEVLFHCTTSETVFLVLKVYGADAPFYVDNISLREAVVSVTNPSDSIRFVYNETAQTNTIPLDGNYKDMKNVQYASTITLQPYSSAVLLRTSSPPPPPPPAQNHAPVANAGTDATIILPTNTATLNGSASKDPDGTIVSYRWTKVSGPGRYAFSNAKAEVTSVARLVEGVYLFRLEVTDNAGTVASDTVAITVKSSATAGAELYAVTQDTSADLKAYPNPATDYIALHHTSSQTGNIRMIIFADDRHVVADRILLKTNVILKTTIDVSAFASGMYYVELITADGKTFIRSFVKL